MLESGRCDHAACFDLVKRSMGNDQRIGMVSVLVMRQCDRRRRSQFGSTRLGEHGGMGRRLTKRTPQGVSYAQRL